MNNIKNDEVINDEPFSIYSLIAYIRENILGLSLLLLAIAIVVFIDYISRYNSMLFSASNPMILPSVIPGGVQFMQINKKIKERKFKK